MKWIIDRFEGKIAVMEGADGSHFELPAAALPEGASEGDVISVLIDHEETDRRRARIAKLRRDLFVD